MRFRLHDDSSTDNDTPIKIDLGINIRDKRPEDIFDILERMGVEIVGGITFPSCVLEAYRQMTDEQRDEFINALIEMMEDEEND